MSVLVLATVQFLTQVDPTAATVALFLAAGSRIIPALLRLQGAGITIRNAAVQAQPAFFMAQFLEDSRSSGDNFTSERARVQELISSRYPDFDASVTVTQAWLSYPGAEAPALQGIDLHVPQGSSVALVGPAGAGKSSRLTWCSASTSQIAVLWTSEPLPPEAINMWPGAIAYVPQAVALVGGSVRPMLPWVFPMY